MKIISGGQTGVDRAALDVALELKLPCGGWCPKGRLAEDGKIASQYPLIETPTSDYSERTEWNVRDSDGTLILTYGTPIGGTGLTVEIAQILKKPLLILDLNNPLPKEEVMDWIQSNQIQTLNVAGPRESFRTEGIYKVAKEYLKSFANLLQRNRR